MTPDPLKQIQRERGITPGTHRAKAARALSAPARSAHAARLEIRLLRGGVPDHTLYTDSGALGDVAGYVVRSHVERYADALRVDIHLPPERERPDRLGSTAGD